MATYIAHGVVRETGATITERICCSGHKMALELSQSWARENALKLWLIEQVREVWKVQS